MKFKATKGSILNQEQAQKYGERIHIIIEQNNGSVTAPDVLQDAKSKRSPLHSFFEWDNDTAANKYRLEQASYLLRSIRVVVKTNGDEEDIRAFFNVNAKSQTNTQTSERVYVSVKRVLDEKDLRKQIIAEALRQLEGWQKRYQQYSNAELKAIFTAIKETKTKNPSAVLPK